MAHILGNFIWYDLMVPDPAKAVEFYTDVVGWETQIFEAMGKEYTMWAVGERPVGGVMELPQEAVEAGAVPHWLLYLAAPDVDQTAARAAELGAHVLREPTDIPDVGRFAVLADPQGATFAIYASSVERDEQAEPVQGKPGTMVWHELMTSDPEAAWNFYSELFGWEKTDSWTDGEYFYQMFGHGEETYGGMGVKPDEMPPYWACYTEVTSLDDAVERSKSQGATLLYGPMEVPGGTRVAGLVDPQGAMFALHEGADEL